MQDRDKSLLQEFFHNKYILIILAIDVLAILVIIGLSILRLTRVSTISLNIAPLDATISINGNTHYTNGQYDITPGTYEVKISHDGLKTKTFSVNIEPHHFVSVTTFLTDDNGGFEFYQMRNNYDSFQKLKTIASAENNITTDGDTSAQEFIVKYEQILSISDVLPLKGYLYAEPSVNMSTGGFAIHEGKDNQACEKTACLLVKYYGKDYENAVIEKIKEANYNPDDYQIVYERYTQQ